MGDGGSALAKRHGTVDLFEAEFFEQTEPRFIAFAHLDFDKSETLRRKMTKGLSQQISRYSLAALRWR